MVKNLKDLFKKFSDDNACRQFLVQQRWNGSPECPYCGSSKWYSIENGKRFKCGNKECYKKYSVTVGTVFEASNIPLTTWFPAMYIIASHKKGISSVQLAKDLGVTQKTAWFMLHRIRESLKDNNPQMLSGIVESDETYMSRKYASDFKGLPPQQLQHTKSNQKHKGAVLGLAERNTGKIIVKSFEANKAENIRPAIKQHVNPGSTLHTDEAFIYRVGLDEYGHETVFHSKREWVRDNVHTNTVENFWSVMKRGIYGIYHQISYKHLQRYCDEYSYRYNSRKLKDGERFELSLTRIEGRLTYKHLVHGKSEESSQAQA
jgi:transposase-like protein